MSQKIILNQVINALEETNQPYTSLTLQNAVCTNPSSVYAEKSVDVPDQQGHSIRVCDVGGMSCGFDELKCNTQVFTDETRRSSGLVETLELLALQLTAVEI